MAQLEDVLTALASSIAKMEKGLSEDRKEKKEKGEGTSRLASDLGDSSMTAAQRAELLRKQLAIETDVNEQKRIGYQLAEQEYEITKKKFELDLEDAKSDEDRAKIQQKMAKALGVLEIKIDRTRRAWQEYEGSADGVADKMDTLLGVSRSFNTTLVGQVGALFKSSKEQQKFAARLKETYTVSNIAESMIQKLVQTSLLGFRNVFSELEEGMTSFVQSTGASKKLTEQVMESSKAYRELGVTMTDAGAAQAQLMSVFPTRELGELSTEISAQFALWQKSGVAIGDSIGSYDMLRRSFKMTDDDARGLQGRIMALGDEIGMGAPKMMQSFADAAPRLAIHGNSMEKVFKKVASASSQLGLEVSDVLALAEGFQTFEGSAQAAGKLNSILGGGFIDNIELMNASFEDPAKAALMIKDSFASAGQSVESLGPAGVKAAAAAAGFSDVAKFTRFLNGEIDASELAADEELNMQKDMLTAAQDTRTILKSFMDAFQSFFNDTLMSPLMDMLNFFKGFSGGIKALIFGIGGVFLTALGGAAAMALAAAMGAAEGAVVAPILATAVAGGNIAGAVPNMATAALQGATAGVSGIGGLALTAGKFLGPIASVGMLGKDLLDALDGDRSMGNAGGMIGAGIGALGFLGGPLVGAATMAAGNLIGEKIGEFYDKKLEADAKMPDTKSPQDRRIDKLADILEKQTQRDQNIKLSLDVDQYAYKKGFRLSAEDMLAQR